MKIVIINYVIKGKWNGNGDYLEWKWKLFDKWKLY